MQIDNIVMDEYMGHIAEIVLKLGIPVKVTVASSSMEPTIKTGTELKVIPKQDSKIRNGDIIVFRQVIGDGLLVHRCIFILPFKKRIFITKGDQFILFDKPVCDDRVYGKVQISNRGIYQLLFRKIQYLFLPIQLLGTLFIRVFFMIRSIYRRKKCDQKC
ncbi:signal peptidase I [Enterococcus hulanensis]|uniref:signal peptidase I n=1 Tax=Enterococcus hulanensis TaxID=2559929 RepID=UPI0028928BC3|nr:signal peptidase I [Enterococcus hulanensis]MDT2661129.1 signal peptidase I [Enterococcus hulanensis]